MDEKHNPIIRYLQETHFRSKDTNRWVEKIFSMQIAIKKSWSSYTYQTK